MRGFILKALTVLCFLSLALCMLRSHATKTEFVSFQESQHFFCITIKYNLILPCVVFNFFYFNTFFSAFRQILPKPEIVHIPVA